MPTNLDLTDFNRVDEYSPLTYQNLLSTLTKLFPHQDEAGRLTQCEIAPTIDSIEYGVNKLRNSPRTQFSLVLGDGIVKNRLNPQSGQSYTEATGGNHWTTLHFRKDHNGKIDAFYSDSSDATSPTIPRQIEDKLKTLGIEADNIHKMRCQSQGINKCGDYSTFNAKAMDLMSFAELKRGSIKQTITLSDGNIIDAQNFSLKLRQDLMAEFNGGKSQGNSSGDSSQKQYQGDFKKNKLPTINHTELSANESIIKLFPDWQRSKKAAYELQGHKIEWTFNDDGFANIQYIDSQNLTFRIIMINKDAPIEVFLETPQGLLQINNPPRAKIFENVATIIRSIAINQERADNFRSEIKSLEDCMSASSINRSSDQSADESYTPSEETRRQIETLKQYINNAVCLIDSKDGKNSYTITDNQECEIKIGLLKSGLKTLIYKDRINEKKFVVEIHGDQLVFFDLKHSDPRPLPTNRINNPRQIESVLTLIRSAVSLTSTSSRTGHTNAIRAGFGGVTASGDGAGFGGVATSGVARANTQPSQPGSRPTSPAHEAAIRPRSPRLN